jgi:hypothetical protein
VRFAKKLLVEMEAFLTGQQMVTALLLAIGAFLYQYLTGKMTWLLFKENAASVVYPFVWVVCGFGVYYIVKAAIDLHREMIAETEAYKPAIPDYRLPRPPLAPSILTASAAIGILVILSGMTFRMAFPKTIAPVVTQSVTPPVPSPIPDDLRASLRRQSVQINVRDINFVNTDAVAGVVDSTTIVKNTGRSKVIGQAFVLVEIHIVPELLSEAQMDSLFAMGDSHPIVEGKCLQPMPIGIEPGDVLPPIECHSSVIPPLQWPSLKGGKQIIYMTALAAFRDRYGTRQSQSCSFFAVQRGFLKRPMTEYSCIVHNMVLDYRPPLKQ